MRSATLKCHPPTAHPPCRRGASHSPPPPRASSSPARPTPQTSCLRRQRQSIVWAVRMGCDASVQLNSLRVSVTQAQCAGYPPAAARACCLVAVGAGLSCTQQTINYMHVLCTLTGQAVGVAAWRGLQGEGDERRFGRRRGWGQPDTSALRHPQPYSSDDLRAISRSFPPALPLDHRPTSPARSPSGPSWAARPAPACRRRPRP